MMKKSLVVASLTFTLSVSVMANDKNWFIGLDMAQYDNSMSGSVTGNDGTYSGSSSDTYTSPNIKLGIEAKNNRQYASYSLLYDKDYISYKSLDFNYDKFAENINGITPYYGGHVGMGWLTVNGVTDSSIEYGFQGGILNRFDKKSSLEVGFKYKIATASLSATYNSTLYTINADNAVALYVGFNTKF